LKKVLIVEDDAMLRNVYEIIVAREGYVVEVARDGSEGLRKLGSFQPDLVLLDMLMPIKSGLQFLKEAKMKLHYPKTSVLILSNLSASDTVNEALRLGAKEHFIKSNLLPKDLVEAVKKYL
jgi:DNA-binding response OmpR family regulator